MRQQEYCATSIERELFHLFEEKSPHFTKTYE
jgi:hypothetical protein